MSIKVDLAVCSVSEADSFMSSITVKNLFGFLRLLNGLFNKVYLTKLDEDYYTICIMSDLSLDQTKKVIIEEVIHNTPPISENVKLDEIKITYHYDHNSKYFKGVDSVLTVLQKFDVHGIILRDKNVPFSEEYRKMIQDKDYLYFISYRCNLCETDGSRYTFYALYNDDNNTTSSIGIYNDTDMEKGRVDITVYVKEGDKYCKKVLTHVLSEYANSVMLNEEDVENGI